MMFFRWLLLVVLAAVVTICFALVTYVHQRGRLPDAIGAFIQWEFGS